MLQSINPATGEPLTTYPEMDRVEWERVLNRVQRAFQDWKSTDYAVRGQCLQRTAQILRRDQESLALLMAWEMGKPLAQGRAEIEKCAWVCDYYADNGEAFLTPEPVATDASRSYVAFQPLGVILAIMPWNFPFWQVFRFLAPTLMAGNAAVLKHASNVTGCALAIEAICGQAGFREDLFRVLRVPSAQMGDVIASPVIQAITLTGSTPAGQSIAAQAGLRKCVLELGGSDPYLILEDADLEAAVETCVASRLINAGQSCIAAKRFLVVPPVYDEFKDRMAARMKQVVMGDPLQAGVGLGPLARPDLRQDLQRQVRQSLEKGALQLVGGEIPEGPGAFFPPAVLAEVRPGMAAFDEELFGPVAAIIPVRDEEEAVQWANQTVFGLGAAVFTRDLERGEQVALRIEAGSCFVNAFVKSDPRLPFGGIKQSGYGRELSIFGIREFTNIKTIYIR